VDVFTKELLEGNSLAVFPDASGLDDNMMQRIARTAAASGIMGGFMESQPVAIRTTTSNGHVQEVVRLAHEELRQLLQQHAEVVHRIRTIKQTIAGLANLFGDVVVNEELLELVDRKSNGRQPGFTKACRMILMDANRALSARDVCDRIHEKLPPMLERHKDPMVSVTTVLNRLVAYGEARAVALENGRRAFKWVADSEPESVSASGLAP
jgi:phenazine biosynthesis-like protein